jgi:hypothetical protein
MRDKVEVANARGLSDCSNCLLDVSDGKLAGFTIDVVTKKNSTRSPAGQLNSTQTKSWPRALQILPMAKAESWNEFFVSVNEYDDLFPPRLIEPLAKLILKKRLWLSGVRRRLPGNGDNPSRWAGWDRAPEGSGRFLWFLQSTARS